jgi:cytochrome oxidase Cu insertion factor (SCO1/SenC/PrrC family)
MICPVWLRDEAFNVLEKQTPRQFFQVTRKKKMSNNQTMHHVVFFFAIQNGVVLDFLWF